jgi:hypothetical protein
MVAKPGRTEYGGVRIKRMDHRRAPSPAASVAPPQNETVDVGNLSIDNHSVKTLAKHVATQLGARAFCLVFDISGFSAPIGGYSIDGPAESPLLTAVPLWRPLLPNNPARSDWRRPSRAPDSEEPKFAAAETGFAKHVWNCRVHSAALAIR